MKILLAIDDSDYTARMLSYLLAHEEWFAAGHAFTVCTVVPLLPRRGAAFAGAELARRYCEDDARMVLEPVRARLAEHGIVAAAVHTAGRPRTGDRGLRPTGAATTCWSWALTGTASWRTWCWDRSRPGGAGRLHGARAAGALRCAARHFGAAP